MRLLPTFLRARLLRIRLLEPLQERDFALLTAGWVVSLLGDGFFSVALGALLFVPGVRDPERRGFVVGQAVGELP